MVTRPGSHNAVRDVVTVGYDTATNVVSVVGGKARTLSALARDGFPVPPAVVLTTSACARVAAASGEVPAEIRAAIAAALGGLGGGGGRLAVRSSAVEEDSRAASYAGAFRSVLNVAAADLGAVCDAVADVVASASEHRVAV
ncbi:MAG TPA: PEP/pyruvate-binding domain-containing protein, partial [Acidothermaceae bacterium]